MSRVVNIKNTLRPKRVGPQKRIVGAGTYTRIGRTLESVNVPASAAVMLRLGQNNENLGLYSPFSVDNVRWSLLKFPIKYAPEDILSATIKARQLSSPTSGSFKVHGIKKANRDWNPGRGVTPGAVAQTGEVTYGARQYHPTLPVNWAGHPTIGCRSSTLDYSATEFATYSHTSADNGNTISIPLDIATLRAWLLAETNAGFILGPNATATGSASFYGITTSDRPTLEMTVNTVPLAADYIIITVEGSAAEKARISDEPYSGVGEALDEGSIIIPAENFAQVEHWLYVPAGITATYTFASDVYDATR